MASDGASVLAATEAISANCGLHELGNGGDHQFRRLTTLSPVCYVGDITWPTIGTRMWNPHRSIRVVAAIGSLVKEAMMMATSDSTSTSASLLGSGTDSSPPVRSQPRGTMASASASTSAPQPWASDSARFLLFHWAVGKLRHYRCGARLTVPGLLPRLLLWPRLSLAGFSASDSASATIGCDCGFSFGFCSSFYFDFTRRRLLLRFRFLILPLLLFRRNERGDGPAVTSRPALHTFLGARGRRYIKPTQDCPAKEEGIAIKD